MQRASPSHSPERSEHSSTCLWQAATLENDASEDVWCQNPPTKASSPLPLAKGPVYFLEVAAERVHTLCRDQPPITQAFRCYYLYCTVWKHQRPAYRPNFPNSPFVHDKYANLDSEPPLREYVREIAVPTCNQIKRRCKHTHL